MFPVTTTSYNQNNSSGSSGFTATGGFQATGGFNNSNSNNISNGQNLSIPLSNLQTNISTTTPYLIEKPLGTNRPQM